MNDDYKDVFESVRAWQGQVSSLEDPLEGHNYWKDIFWWGTTGMWGYTYLIEQAGANSFIGGLRSFFQNIWNWVTNQWLQLYAWLHEISSYIQSLWNSLGQSLYALYTWIGEKIEGVITLIGNWAMILWEWLVSDIWAIVDYLINPLLETWNYLTATLAEWFDRIRAILAAFVSDPLQWVYDLGAEIWEALAALGAQIWNAMIETANAAAFWIGEKIAALAPVIVEHLRDLFIWIWEAIKASFTFIRDDIMMAAAEATSGALGWLKDQFTHLMGLAYDEFFSQVKRFVPMTPERAPALGAIMFGSAVGFGALAHGMALGVEMLPNLKYMGVHYLSAFVARMGSFGTISAATMGVFAAVSVRKPFTYYMHSLLRPIQPASADLQIMAVKPDIPMDVFKRGMTYEGYSDYWIGRFQATMYHEPRYFELSMMAEDASATPTWLYTKARRSGYSELDAKIFVSSIAKKASRTQRQDFYKAVFNLFKEGYISEYVFKSYLEQLEMIPTAQEFAVSGAKLAYHFDLFKDLTAAYRTAFRRDLISEEELSSSLSGLGLEPERVDSIVYSEWTKKTPSAVKAERKEIAKEWAAVVKEYTKVYLEAFRRGLIEESQLVTYLVALGIKAQVAGATARYEALKRLPKPKYEEVGEEVLPSPPEPPELLE